MSPAAPTPPPAGARGTKAAPKRSLFAPIKMQADEWRRRYQSWPADRRRSVTLGVAFGCVAVNLLAVFSPLCALTLKLQQKNTQVHVEYKSAVEDIRRRSEMEKLLDDSSALLEKASARTLADAAAETLFLETLEKLAQAHGLKIVQLAPFVKPDPSREKAGSTPLPPGFVLAWTEVTLTGGFHSFGKFVAQLENDGIFAAILDIEATQAPPESVGGHSFRLLLGTVRRLSAAEASAGSRGGGGES